MNQYILDTDCFTLLQQFHPNVIQRFSTIEPENITITIITVEEQIRGWLNAIRKHSQSSHPERVIQAYLSFEGRSIILVDLILLISVLMPIIALQNCANKKYALAHKICE